VTQLRATSPAQEDLLTFQSASDLSNLAQEPAAPPVPGLAGLALDDQETVLAPRQDTKQQQPSRPRQETTSRPRIVPQAPPAAFLYETESTRGALVKAVILGAIAAAPFCVWAGLVALGDATPFPTYVQAFGEIVQEVFDAALGG
jgi:hypothetical protein